MRLAFYRPSERHWKQLEEFYQCVLMEFDKFREKYPNLTREQIARVANCSPELVNRWFVKTGKTGKKPTEEHKLRFALADYVWSRDKLEPTAFEEFRQLKQEFNI